MEEKIFTVKIEKLIFGGQALAKIDNYPLFIEGGCPEDIVEIEILKRNKSYGVAKINKIIEPSENRVQPFCPMHNVCGSCGLQHIKYEEQLKQKQNIVKETILKIYGKDLNVKPIKCTEENTKYRHKIQYPVSQTKVSKRLLIGYYKKNSHETINLKYCPVQPAIIDEITEFIRNTAQELNICSYNEKKHNGLLRHIVFRISNYNKQILVNLVINDTKIPENLKKLANKLINFENIVGVSANLNNKKTNVITIGKSKNIVGENYIIEKINNVLYKVSADSFFQVNPEGAKIIFDTAKQMIIENVKNPTILDAYSGVSAFGLQMADIAKNVVCVEENKSSTDDAVENVKLNNIKNIEIINDDASKTFEKFVKSNKKFDVVLLDPPRKGCSEESISYATKLSNNLIVYVSCNPTTLARDLKLLEEKNFKPLYVQPVDMFCHTPHIENVVLIKKEIK